MSQFTDDEIIQEAFRRMRKRQKRTGPPRAKVLRPCPKCEQLFGARDLRKHKPQCKGRP